MFSTVKNISPKFHLCISITLRKHIFCLRICNFLWKSMYLEMKFKVLLKICLKCVNRKPACKLIYLITKHGGGHEIEYYKTWGCGVEKGKSNIANCYSSLWDKNTIKITAENFYLIILVM